MKCTRDASSVYLENLRDLQKEASNVKCLRRFWRSLEIMRAPCADVLSVRQPGARC
jgi:hypothetical protein